MFRHFALCVLTIGLLASSLPLTAQAASLADRVFQKAKGAPEMLKAVGDADRRAVVALLPLALNERGIVVDNMEGCNKEARPELNVVDLRGDGQPAVLAVMGNGCTSGGTGASFHLVVKTGGTWRHYFDIPAIEYRVLPTVVNGWPEIGLLGRYECIGAWQFDGRAFVHSRNIDEKGALCKNRE